MILLLSNKGHSVFCRNWSRLLLCEIFGEKLSKFLLAHLQRIQLLNDGPLVQHCVPKRRHFGFCCRASRFFSVQISVLILGHIFNKSLQSTCIFEPNWNWKFSHGVPSEWFLKCEPFCNLFRNDVVIFWVQSLANHGTCPLANQINISTRRHFRVSFHSHTHKLFHGQSSPVLFPHFVLFWPNLNFFHLFCHVGEIRNYYSPAGQVFH